MVRRCRLLCRERACARTHTRTHAHTRKNTHAHLLSLLSLRLVFCSLLLLLSRVLALFCFPLHAFLWGLLGKELSTLSWKTQHANESKRKTYQRNMRAPPHRFGARQRLANLAFQNLHVCDLLIGVLTLLLVSPSRSSLSAHPAHPARSSPCHTRCIASAPACSEQGNGHTSIPLQHGHRHARHDSGLVVT